MMSVLARLKPVRNAVADSAANLVVRAPALEPAFRAAGRILSRIPLVETVYRRASDTLVGRWAGANCLVRPVRIGTLDMWFDVEGAEELVLDGIAATLRDAPPRAIICETVWNGQAHALLTAHGYRARPLDWWECDLLNILYVHDPP